MKGQLSNRPSQPAIPDFTTGGIQDQVRLKLGWGKGVVCVKSKTGRDIEAVILDGTDIFVPVYC